MEDSEVVHDCALQVIIGSRTVVDTDLITREEANDLWGQWRGRVLDAFKKGESVEAALWIEMTYRTNYRKTEWRFTQEDLQVSSGRVYLLTPVP